MSVCPEPSTPVAVMSLQPQPETAPLKPKEKTPPSSLSSQLTPVIAVSVSAVALMGATLLWATSFSAPERTTPVAVDVDDLAGRDALQLFWDLRDGVGQQSAFDETQLPALQALAATTRFAPRGAGGPPGLLLVGVARGSMAERAGLSIGDHVSAINGVSLEERTTAKKLYEEAGADDGLVVEVVRLGHTSNVRYSNRLIVADRGVQ